MLLSLVRIVVRWGCICSRWWWRRRWWVLLGRRRFGREHITGSTWEHNKPCSYIEVGVRYTGAQIEGCCSTGNGAGKHIDAVSFDPSPQCQINQCMLLLGADDHLGEQCSCLINQRGIEGREFVPVIVLRMMMMHQYIMTFVRTTQAG